MRIKFFLIFVICLVTNGWSFASDINQPSLSITYKERFQLAWDKAGEGELPVYECARVVGTATKILSEDKKSNSEAQQAYKACYVDAILKYTNAFFKMHNRSLLGENNKPSGCPSYSRYLTAHVVSLDVYAGRFGLASSDLNNEIKEKLDEPASLCEVSLD